jgi:hypothetical protein
MSCGISQKDFGAAEKSSAVSTHLRQTTTSCVHPKCTVNAQVIHMLLTALCTTFGESILVAAHATLRGPAAFIHPE